MRASSGQTAFLKLERSSDGIDWVTHEEFSTTSTTEVNWWRLRDCNFRFWRVLVKTSGDTSWYKLYEFVVVA